VQGTQCYATADLGLIAYETSAREGLVLDEGVLVEIVRPGTGDPVPDGEVGEVVVTTFNPDYPLVRFGTGDLSAVLPALPHRAHQQAHQGLARPRRPDDQGARHVRAPRPGGGGDRRFPAVLRARLVVEGEMADDRMTLDDRMRGPPEGLERAHGRRAMREVPPSCAATIVRWRRAALPNDGKVIEDARSYK
jgi:phenylacetate-CoA ligase